MHYVVINTISLCCTPFYGTSFTPDGNYIYVTNYDWPEISIYKTSNYAAYATITTGIPYLGPWGIAITPNGALGYVTNYGQGTVNVINIAANTVVSGPPIIVGADPQGVATTPDGNYVYVANYGGDSVSQIQISTDTVVNTISMGTGFAPWGVAISPDGANVYVTGYGANTVETIRAGTSSIANKQTRPTARLHRHSKRLGCRINGPARRKLRCDRDLRGTPRGGNSGSLRARIAGAERTRRAERPLVQAHRENAMAANAGWHSTL